MMTPWFKAGIAPAHDGWYITRYIHSGGWHFMRWNTKTQLWYSAGSTGTDRKDVIGCNASATTYEWRGLNKPFGEQQ